MGKEFRLAQSARINGIQVSKGDILRENSTSKTVKVLNVLRNSENQHLLQVEYNSPSGGSGVFQKPLESFSFLS
jgi:hypothetical protein